LRNDQNTIELCLAALQSVRSSISQERALEIEQCITTYNEWGLGLENLIVELIDQDVKILPIQYESFSRAMAAMELSESSLLKELRSQLATS
jgi:hypothetical protein